MGVVHWDDVEAFHRAKGEMDATWWLLGDAAGTVGVGVNRVRVAPGKLPTPPHSHQSSEEVYFVLDGSGLAWQDGPVLELRPCDCVIQRPNEHAHTFIAGPDGLDFLVLGTRHPHELGWLPRSGALLTEGVWVHGRMDDPWDLEAQAPPLTYGDPAPRPPNILNVEEVELERWGAAVTAPLATRERSNLAGFHWERIDPGGTGPPPHCHSEEEEVFVILDGDGVLELWPSPRRHGTRRRPRGHPCARRARDRAAAGDTGRSRVPRGRRRADDAHLRHAQAERPGVLPALEQDRIPRSRRDRTDRVARLLGRRT
jgi:uncharacterized cupin superfamily protein